LLVGVPGRVGLAEEAQRVSLGPVPPGVDAIIVSEAQRTLGALATGALVGTRRPSRPEHDATWARSLLVLLGEPGLKLAWEALAREDLPRAARPQLLQVAASFSHPEVDVLLRRAAASRRPILRMIAARGLGRSPNAEAITALSELARDPRGSVRAAALRSLFSLDSPGAQEARVRLPADPDPLLLAERFSWHRRARDRSISLAVLSQDVIRDNANPWAKLEAYWWLSLPTTGAQPEMLAEIIRVMEPAPEDETAFHGRIDAITRRRVAIEAASTMLAHPKTSEAQRTKLIATTLDWVASPVRMDPRSRDSIPEERLLRTLPDLGSRLVEPLVRRLEGGAFFHPGQGMRLLRSIETPEARAAVMRLAQLPRIVTPGKPDRTRDVLRGEATYALSRWKHIGDEATVRTLLHSDLDINTRRDVVQILGTHDGAWVGPLLIEMLGDTLAYKRLLPWIGRSVPRDADPRDRTRIVQTVLRARTNAADSRAFLARYFGAGEARDPGTSGRWIRIFRPMIEAEAKEYAGLEEWIIGALEQRSEPLVRDFLTELFFRRGTQPHQRIRALLHPTDEQAWATLRRALSDKRLLIRLSAWSALTHDRLLRGRKARELATTFAVHAKGSQEVQGALYALIRHEPGQAIRFVRSRWDDLPSQSTSLAQLQDMRGQGARHAAADLAFELAVPTGDRDLLMASAQVFSGTTGHRTEEITAFWRMLLTHKRSDMRTAAVHRLSYADCPDLSDLLVPMLERARKEQALEEDGSALDEIGLALELLDAFQHQPWEKVEKTVIDTVLDSITATEVRLKAARLCVARLTTEGRTRLLGWLIPAGPEAKGAGIDADAALQASVALAIGYGGDATAAARMQRALEDELSAHLKARDVAEDTPVMDFRMRARASALAQGLREARDEASIAAAVRLLWLPRFGVAATRALADARLGYRQGDVASTVRPAATIARRLHESDDAPALLHPAAEALATNLRGAPDDLLARVLEEALGRAAQDGALALFPDLYLYKIARILRDGRAGTPAHKAAAVVESYTLRLAPIGSVADMTLYAERAERRARAGRPVPATADARRAARWIVQHNAGDPDGLLASAAQARADAIEGQAHAVAGDVALARDAFRRALLRGPGDPQFLLRAALHRSLAAFEPDIAEQEARRALKLEARLHEEPRLDVVDQFAEVLLRVGKPAEGAAALSAALDIRKEPDSGRYHLHLAQAEEAAGARARAERALVDALVIEPGLVIELESDPWLGALAKSPRMEALLRYVKRLRREVL
jgi:hypothetical protein